MVVSRPGLRDRTQGSLDSESVEAKEALSSVQLSWPWWFKGPNPQSKGPNPQSKGSNPQCHEKTPGTSRPLYNAYYLCEDSWDIPKTKSQKTSKKNCALQI